MKKEFIIESEKINLTYTLIKKTGIKNITIRIKPFKGIIVSAPYFSTKNDIERILEIKKNWISNSLKRIELKEEQRTIFKPGLDFQTLNHILVFIPRQGRKISLHIADNQIKVFYPEETIFEEDHIQSFIKKGIEKALIIEAAPILKERIKILAEEFNFDFVELRVKSLKSSWGNCSVRNVITLNSHLIRVPEHLRDYVILHELCHTIQKNHGRNFWLLLQSVTNNRAYELRKEIRNFSPRIY